MVVWKLSYMQMNKEKAVKLTGINALFILQLEYSRTPLKEGKRSKALACKAWAKWDKLCISRFIPVCTQPSFGAAPGIPTEQNFDRVY